MEMLICVLFKYLQKHIWSATLQFTGTIIAQIIMICKKKLYSTIEIKSVTHHTEKNLHVNDLTGFFFEFCRLFCNFGLMIYEGC